MGLISSGGKRGRRAGEGGHEVVCTSKGKVYPVFVFVFGSRQPPPACVVLSYKAGGPSLVELLGDLLQLRPLQEQNTETETVGVASAQQQKKKKRTGRMDGRQKFSHQLLSKVVGDVVVVPIVFPPLGVREALLFFVPLCQIEIEIHKVSIASCGLTAGGKRVRSSLALVVAAGPTRAGRSRNSRSGP